MISPTPASRWLACALWCIWLVAGCKSTDAVDGSSAEGFGPGAPSIQTTYYPYNEADARSMGPGHFSCAWLNYEQNWYLAPSDTFGDERLWNGPPCPANPWGGVPDCAAVQRTCGVKVRVSCASNCKGDAPAVVAMITDVCPRNHPQNRSSGACQNGPHFDIAHSIWQLMRDRDDNIRVTYEVVDANTPLGPVPAGTSTKQQQSPAVNTNDSWWCDPSNKTQCYPYCNNGSNSGNQFGWQPNLGGPNGGSCRVPDGNDARTAPSGGVPSSGTSGSNRWCDPDISTLCYPYCTNTTDVGKGYGWQPELGGPKGGLCRRPAAPAGNSGNWWCDPSNKSACFPYCTNGSGGGDGFGWQPELGGPNGGSCKTSGGASGSSSSNTANTWWCDPSNKSYCFPYCTNGSNSGNNFGWQPELGGPNGGSCRTR